MFAVICGIISAIAASVTYQIITAVVLAAVAAFWDEWGRDFLVTLCAVVCIVGVLYYAAGYLLYGWTVGIQDLAVLALLGVVGSELIGEWLVKAIKWIVAFVAEILAAVASGVFAAFPWLLPAGLGFLAIWLLSGDSDSQPEQVNSQPEIRYIPVSKADLLAGGSSDVAG